MLYLRTRLDHTFTRIRRKIRDRLKIFLSRGISRRDKPAPLAEGVVIASGTPTKQAKRFAYEANRLNRLLCEAYGSASPVSFPTAIFPAIRLKPSEKGEVLYGDGSVRRWFEIAPVEGGLLVEYWLGGEEQCLELTAGEKPCLIAAEKVRLAVADETAVCDVTVK